MKQVYVCWVNERNNIPILCVSRFSLCLDAMDMPLTLLIVISTMNAFG